MRAGFGRRRPAWPASRPCAQPACPSAGSRPALPPKLASASSKPCPAPSWAPLGLLCPVPAVFGAGASRHRHRSARHARAPGRETRGVDRRWRACGIVCGLGKTGRAGKTTRAGRMGSAGKREDPAAGLGLRKAGSADQDRAGREAESQRFGSDESLPGASAWRICRIIAPGRGLALSPLVRSALAESALRASGDMPAKAGTRRVTVWPADPGTSRPGLDASHRQQARAGQGGEGAGQGEVSGGRPEASMPGACGA